LLTEQSDKYFNFTLATLSGISLSFLNAKNFLAANRRNQKNHGKWKSDLQAARQN